MKNSSFACLSFQLIWAKNGFFLSVEHNRIPKHPHFLPSILFYLAHFKFHPLRQSSTKHRLKASWWNEFLRLLRAIFLQILLWFCNFFLLRLKLFLNENLLKTVEWFLLFLLASVLFREKSCHIKWKPFFYKSLLCISEYIALSRPIFN